MPIVVLLELSLQGIDAGLQIGSLLNESLLLVYCCLCLLVLVLDVFVVQLDKVLLEELTG